MNELTSSHSASIRLVLSSDCKEEKGIQIFALGFVLSGRKVKKKEQDINNQNRHKEHVFHVVKIPLHV